MQLFTSRFADCGVSSTPEGEATLSSSRSGASKVRSLVIFLALIACLFGMGQSVYAQTSVFGPHGFEAANGQVSYALVSGATIGTKSNNYITGAVARTGSGFASIQAQTNFADGYLFISLSSVQANVPYVVYGYTTVGVSGNSDVKPGVLEAYLVANTAARPTASPLASFTVSEAVAGYRQFTLSFTPTSATNTVIAIRMVIPNGSGNNNSFLSIDDLSVATCAGIPTLTLPQAQLCANSAAFNLSGGSPAGGTYSVDGVTATTFDPAARGVGTYSIRYTTPCGTSTAQTLTVNALPTLTLPQTQFCANNTPFTLSGGAPAGGTYRVDGTVATTFTPSASNVGTHTVVYTTVCGNSTSQTFTVIALPTLSALGSICEGSSKTLSGGAPVGGSYSGLGVTNPSAGTYVFNAAGTLAPGDYTITYSTGCGSASQTITIIPKPAFSQSFKAVCAGTTIDLAPYASPSGGTFSGSGVTSSGIFNPGGLTGTGPFTVTYTTPCGSATIDLNVTGTSDWTGAVSNDWSDARNWSNCIPSTTIGAFIPTSTTNNYPVITPGTTVAVRSLVVAGNWQPTSGNIDLHGDLIISGSGRFIHSGGTVTLRGNSQIVGVATFDNLTVATTGTTALNGNIAVTGTLTMQSGVLNTGELNGSADFRIDLGTTGTLVETETSYVFARVRAERAISGSSVQNFGGIGMSLELTSGTSPGTIVINRVSGSVGAIQTGEGTSQSIQRYFDVVAVPAATAPFTLSGTLSYRQAELNGLPENNLRAFRSANGGNPWTPLPSAVNPGGNVVSFSNLTALGRITLGDLANPLPVSLVAFEAKSSNQAVHLTWSTATEKDNRGFGVEVAAQGSTNFQELAFVPSWIGNSTTLQSYTYTDSTPRAAGTYYYRLRQVDTDGVTSYSPVRSVTMNHGANSAKAYPNPFTSSFTVELPAQLRQQAATLVLHDALGREVYRSTKAADSTNSGLLTISPNTRTPGVYVLSILTGNQPVQRIRLVQE